MKKKLQLTALLALSILTFETKAQLPDGSTAPNFTFTDMDGNTQDLYSYLNAGKPVVIDISATWCHPCWNYHTSGALEDFYNQKGPPGTDEVMVIFIEADWTTSDSDMYGTGNFTEGDWVTGTPYPMCNPPAPDIDNFLTDYQNIYVPCIYLICTDKETHNLGQLTTTELDSALSTCGAFTSTNNLNLNSEISVFPNPSAGNVFVTMPPFVTENATITILNAMGEIVAQRTRTVASGKTLGFDLTRQSAGIYMVEIRSGELTKTKKIALQR